MSTNNLKTLYWLTYNGYYGRESKGFDALSDYMGYALGAPSTGVSFNPNDGVSTEVIANREESEIGDYVIVVDGADTIESRWFVMDSVRIRKGQYRVILRRDLIQDYYDDVIEAPCFIEKATLSDSDPFIFNDEGMTFNQIKTSETQIKDETGGAWVVGYVPADAFSESATITAKGGIAGESTAFDTTDDITAYEYNGVRLWDYTSSGDKTVRSYVAPSQLVVNAYSYVQYKGDRYSGEYSYGTRKLSWSLNGPQSDNWTGTDNDWTDSATDPLYPDEALTSGSQTLSLKYPESSSMGYINGTIQNDSLLNAMFGIAKFRFYRETEAIYELMVSAGLLTSLADYEAFQYLDGKVIKDTSTGINYRVSLQAVNQYTANDPIVDHIEYGSSVYEAIYDSLSSAILGYSELGTPTAYNGSRAFSYRFATTVNEYQIAFEEVTQDASVTLTGARYGLTDSPYHMFCIPYSESISIQAEGDVAHGGETFSTEPIKGIPELATNVAVNIGSQSGTGNIYDVQILPYCPARYIIQSDGSLDCSRYTYNPITVKGYYTYVTRTDRSYNADTGGIDSTITKTREQSQGETVPTRIISHVLGPTVTAPDGTTYIQYDILYEDSAITDITIGVVL